MSHLYDQNKNNTWTGTNTFTGAITITDVNIALSTSTGTKIGTGTTQKLAFYNSTPIVQPNATTDLGVVLSNLGLRAAGTAYPITTSGAVTLGSLTSGRIPIAGTAGLLGDDADLTFATDTLSFTKGVSTRITFTAGSGGTTSGMLWNDSTQKAIAVYESGVKQMLVGTLFTQTATATVANTVTETALSSTGVGTLTLPANFFVGGKTIRLRMWGYHSSTGNPTITIKVKLGSTTVATMTGSSGNSSTDTFEVWADLTCRTTGGSGTVFAQGIYREVHNSGLIAGADNTATSTIDTTASQAVSITAKWGTAAAGNTISATNFTLEALN